MRIAALYDVHGNLPALEAVLAEVEREDVDLVLVGGDVVSGPLPRESLAALTELGERAHFIRGNGDREVVEIRDGSRREREAGMSDPWIADQLTDEQAAFLAGIPERAALDVDGIGPVLFCHATPRSDEELFTRLSSDERVRAMFAGAAERVIVCGHVHVQNDRRLDDKRIVNAGSVGMPYEEEPGAYWLLLGPDISFRRTEYDLEEAAARIRASGWPKAEAFATENVLAMPPQAEVLEFFERQLRGG